MDSSFSMISQRSIHTPPAATRRVPHRRHESALTCLFHPNGHSVVNTGSLNPFLIMVLPSLREWRRRERVLGYIDDTFAFIENQPPRWVRKRCLEFLFQSAIATAIQTFLFTYGHRHQDSNLSVSSQAPPISLFYNCSFSTLSLERSSVSNSMIHSPLGYHDECE